MQQHQEITHVNRIVDKVSKVKAWIEYLSQKRGELGGHSICPYAFSASVHIEERELRSVSLNSVPDVDVIIYIVEDDISEVSMHQKIAELNMSQTEYIVLDDHRDDSTFINDLKTNFSEHNLILIQKRDKLSKAREQLHQTNYYDYWSTELYRRIVDGKQSDRFRQDIYGVGDDSDITTSK